MFNTHMIVVVSIGITIVAVLFAILVRMARKSKQGDL